jgi:2-hydroxy-3-oxopropionate reductase
MTALTGTTIGFIGLGLMGKPMARNLHRAGAPMVISNRSQGVVEELAGLGMEPATSPQEVGERAGIVILMLSDTPTVEQVLLGPAGLIQGLKPGSLVIDMGTTAVLATRTLGQQVMAAGSDYLDAPVSGGQLGAEQASLTIMAGGGEAAMARARPVLAVLGRRITHVGNLGAGQVAKAANQVIVGLTIGAVAEALLLAKRAGVDPAKVREALMGGFAASRILELHGERMIEGRFEPGGKVTTQHKDLSQALELASALGLELPATALNRHLYQRLIDQGGGSLDHSALIQVLEGSLRRVG